MRELRFMMMDWERFFKSERVRRMPALVRGVYALALGQMWLNGGWLPVNDIIIARMLGLDVRTWRLTYKGPITACFATRNDAILASVYVQDVLQEVLQSSQAIHEKNVAAAARARAGKAAKSTNRASTAERPFASRPEPATAPAQELAQGTKEQGQKKIEGSATHMAESPLSANRAGFGALPLRDADGAPAVESVTPPSSLASEPVIVTKPDDPKLVDELVKRGLEKGRFITPQLQQMNGGEHADEGAGTEAPARRGAPQAAKGETHPREAVGLAAKLAKRDWGEG